LKVLRVSPDDGDENPIIKIDGYIESLPREILRISLILDGKDARKFENNFNMALYHNDENVKELDRFKVADFIKWSMSFSATIEQMLDIECSYRLAYASAFVDSLHNCGSITDSHYANAVKIFSLVKLRIDNGS
jgi:hypothetical protein